MSESRTEPTSQQTPYEDIVLAQIERGQRELERRADGLFLSALAAGLDIGFGPLAMVIFLSLIGGAFGHFLSEFILANLYSIGFIFVVIGRSELFTEHTATAVFPVLDGRESLAALGRLWGVVFVGNVIGAAIFAGGIVFATPTDLIHPEAFAELAATYTTQESLVLLVGAVFAGWLMGLVSWLVAAAQDTMGRVFFVWLPTAVIAFAHFPHSIAGTVEVLLGTFASPDITLFEYGRFLLIATVGNAIGGTFFIALLRYGHVVRSDGR
ncbi:MAG TPA: formate/nitrite transporter family protein [Halococcus sp.]|nr:formate/nitrite transporter family protein [Halococcus sp.]